MGTIHLKFHGFKRKPFISIDDKPIKLGADWKHNEISVQALPGEHKIFICEKKLLYKWYWWLSCLNILYPLMCWKGVSGGQAGYDGECICASFKMTCSDGFVSKIVLSRKEIPWEYSHISSGYNHLSLNSNTRIHIASMSADKKRIYRIKLGMAVPFILTAILFSCAWISLLIQKKLATSEILPSCIIEVVVISYSAYRIYRIKSQKGYSEYGKVSRVDITEEAE